MTTEHAPLCKACRARSDVGEFRAGLNRMLDGLDKTGSHKTAADAGTDYTYLQCRDCGEKWMLAEDSTVRSRYLSRRA